MFETVTQRDSRHQSFVRRRPRD